MNDACQSYTTRRSNQGPPTTRPQTPEATALATHNSPQPVGSASPSSATATVSGLRETVRARMNQRSPFHNAAHASVSQPGVERGPRYHTVVLRIQRP